MTVKFIVNSSYTQFDETAGQKDITLPAFYIPYLIWCKDKSDQATAFKAIRVLGNVAGIVLALPSGGTSLTTSGALGIAISGTDIIITLANDQLQTTPKGKCKTTRAIF